MQSFTYPVALTADEHDGGFVVTCRDIPEAITQCESPADCLEEAEGALQATVEARIMDDLDIPPASEPVHGEIAVSLPVTTALKAALYLSMRDAGLSKSALARRLGIDEKEARRMLTPGHPTKAVVLERALHALGKRIEIKVA